MQAGQPEDTMGMCVAQLPGELHAVLGVKCGPELYILDNRTDRILPLSEVPYTWQYIPKYLQPDYWEA